MTLESRLSRTRIAVLVTTLAALAALASCGRSDETNASDTAGIAAGGTPQSDTGASAEEGIPRESVARE